MKIRHTSAALLLIGATSLGALTTHLTGCIDYSASIGCESNSDCRDDRVCVAGRCEVFEVYDLPSQNNATNSASNNVANNVSSNNTSPTNNTSGNTNNANSTSPECIRGTTGDCTPCAEFSTDELQFGLVPIGEARTERLTVHNCSDLPLQVREFGIYQDRGPDFEISSWSGGEPPFTLPAREEAFIEFTYSPTSRGFQTARFYLLSNDTSGRSNVVYLEGDGLEEPLDNVCPIASAIAFSVEGGQGPDKVLDDVPPGTIILDATGSYDPDGSITSYAWSVARRPAGSESLIEEPNDPFSSIRVDEEGRYEILLRVYDDFGTESCEPMQIFVNVCEDCAGDP